MSLHYKMIITGSNMGIEWLALDKLDEINELLLRGWKKNRIGNNWLGGESCTLLQFLKLKLVKSNCALMVREWSYLFGPVQLLSLENFIILCNLIFECFKHIFIYIGLALVDFIMFYFHLYCTFIDFSAEIYPLVFL